MAVVVGFAMQIRTDYCVFVDARKLQLFFSSSSSSIPFHPLASASPPDDKGIHERRRRRRRNIFCRPSFQSVLISFVVAIK
jgi:hypothetical protein